VNGIKLGIYIVLFIVLQKQVFCWILLPGDSLLFLAGIYNRELIENIVFIDSDFIVILLSTLVGIAGVGEYYWLLVWSEKWLLFIQ
jgi:membrane-associated protein